ncbi:double zinc ribbon domain-containing protein [Deinococcus apachensis]|uniref:double zinc ribbon domain-containing protein n=1 Tax=Deinococcus apachensis TaxID=309886 RepID=UPI0003818236|nr:zinc ribbon domain-containing protein [Deinococcus apachensis]
MDDPLTTSPALTYRLCPHCARAVPGHSAEFYCANDGTRLLEVCPQCGAPITSPYARFCVRCGANLTWPPGSPPSQR